MTQRSSLAAASLLLVACGGKAPDSGSSPAASARAPITAEMPDDADARAFAQRLVAFEVRNWRPVSGGGAVFEYQSMTFQPDGRWQAEASVTAHFEEMPCTEQGTWAIAEAHDRDSATMQWTVERTNCAAREAGTAQRVRFTFQRDGQYQIALR